MVIIVMFLIVLVMAGSLKWGIIRMFKSIKALVKLLFLQEAQVKVISYPSKKYGGNNPTQEKT